MTDREGAGRYPDMPAYGAGSAGRPSPPPDSRFTSGTPAPAPAPGSATGTWAAVGIGVVLNVATLVGVLSFGWPPGNVFVLFWLENAVLGITTFVRILTARGAATGKDANFQITVNDRPTRTTPGTIAMFFCVHYGVFCLVHLVFTLFVAFKIGFQPTPLLLAIPFALIVLRYTVEMATTWFGPGDLRHTTSAPRAMMAPYPRIIVLHIAVLLGFGLVLGVGRSSGWLGSVSQAIHWIVGQLPAAGQSDGVVLVGLLIGVKIVVDAGTTWSALRVGRGV